MATLTPLAEALQVLLGLLRDNGVPQRMVAVGGQYQQSLPQGKVYQLLRVRIDEALGVTPEITGHRLMVSVRFMRPDAEGRLRNAGTDTTFELSCAPDEHQAGERRRAQGALPDLSPAGRLCARQPLAALLQRTLPQCRPGRLGQRELPHAGRKPRPGPRRCRAGAELSPIALQGHILSPEGFVRGELIHEDGRVHCACRVTGRRK
jgi:hypothetical protein